MKKIGALSSDTQREGRMLVTDILNSCVHEQVAEAAVASIGGDFADRVKLSASAQGRTIGLFTAERVRKFTNFASERDWRVLAAQMHGEDLPLLAGLQIVVSRMMTTDDASVMETRL